MADGGPVKKPGLIDSVVSTVKEAFEEPKQTTSKPAPEPDKQKARDLAKGMGYAEGGAVKASKSKPRMVESSIIKTKLRDEDDIMGTMPPKDHTEHIAYDDDHALKSKNMAEGGEVEEPMPTEDPMESRPNKGWGAIIVKGKAEGGMIDAADEIADDHAESIADAIMAKRRKMAEGGNVMHPGDEMLKEGEVDLDDNGREIPNAYYKANHEILEDNLDHDIMQMHQPEDSNEHDVSLESDTHDMVSRILHKMKNKHK